MDLGWTRFAAWWLQERIVSELVETDTLKPDAHYPFERVVCIGLNGPFNKKALQTMLFPNGPVHTTRLNG